MKTRIQIMPLAMLGMGLLFGVLIGVSASVSAAPVPEPVVVRVPCEIPTQTPHVCPALPPPCPTILYRVRPDPDAEMENLVLASISLEQARKQMGLILAMEGVYHEAPHAQAIVATNFILDAVARIEDVHSTLYGWHLHGELTCPQFGCPDER